MTTAAARDAPASAPTAPAVRLPLLQRLFDACNGQVRTCLADLGPVQPGIVERLVDTRSRLDVLDVPARRAAGESWPGAAAAAEPAGVVLCWDLLNYLDVDELRALSAAIACIARADARVHALIQYSATTMPSQPCRMRIDRELGMRPEPTPDTVAPPRYSPKALEKAMPQLQVESTMLLNNGMQEFLFALRER